MTVRKRSVQPSLRYRLARLEAAVKPAGEGPSLRIGILRQLPADYHGERHIAITRLGEMEGDRQWCDFEERPGPAPAGPPDPVPRLCLTETRLRIAGEPIEE
jgi:hypothetical protein